MKCLLILGLLFLFAMVCRFAVTGNWPWFLVLLGLCAGVLWLAAVENRWAQRLHLQHLQWRMRHLRSVSEKTVDEMAHEWHHHAGSDHWHALSAWLDELHMERVALRRRIEDLTYKLGLDKY